MSSIYLFCKLETYYFVFSNLPVTCVIYAINAAEATKISDQFSGTIRVMTEEQITDVEAASVGKSVTGYYDLSGRRVAEPLTNGITIIRYTDGTSRKVIRK